VILWGNIEIEFPNSIIMLPIKDLAKFQKELQQEHITEASSLHKCDVPEQTLIDYSRNNRLPAVNLGKLMPIPRLAIRELDESDPSSVQYAKSNVPAPNSN
jgi:hypothetical protein